MTKTMKARFHSRCDQCQGHINPGDTIKQEGSHGPWVHTNCPTFIGKKAYVPIIKEDGSFDKKAVTPSIREMYDAILKDATADLQKQIDRQFIYGAGPKTLEKTMTPKKISAETPKSLRKRAKQLEKAEVRAKKAEKRAAKRARRTQKDRELALATLRDVARNGKNPDRVEAARELHNLSY